ncbi:MAG: hypothetical protein AB1476_01200 [Candidatus Hadarchaeota archaeon]
MIENLSYFLERGVPLTERLGTPFNHAFMTWMFSIGIYFWKTKSKLGWLKLGLFYSIPVLLHSSWNHGSLTGLINILSVIWIFVAAGIAFYLLWLELKLRNIVFVRTPKKPPATIRKVF